MVLSFLCSLIYKEEGGKVLTGTCLLFILAMPQRTVLVLHTNIIVILVCVSTSNRLMLFASSVQLIVI